jgi:hypothetical protein
MKPVDHIAPTVPANRVRRVEEKRRQQDPEAGRKAREERGGSRPGDDPDGRTHIIDELA